MTKEKEGVLKATNARMNSGTIKQSPELFQVKPELFIRKQTELIELQDNYL